MCECVCGYTETSCAFYSTIFYKVLLSYIYIVTVNKKKINPPKNMQCGTCVKHYNWDGLNVRYRRLQMNKVSTSICSVFNIY